MSLEVVKDRAILYSNFNITYSNKNTFSGIKAVDYLCALCTSEASPCVCISLVATDLDLALRSYDQVFRRLLTFGHDRSADLGGLALAMVVDETGMGPDQESSAAEYKIKIETFLREIWAEQYDKVR